MKRASEKFRGPEQHRLPHRLVNTRGSETVKVQFRRTGFRPVCEKPLLKFRIVRIGAPSAALEEGSPQAKANRTKSCNDLSILV